MHKRIPVVELDINDLSAGINSIGTLREPEHLPVGIGMVKGRLNSEKLIDWWDGRAIPASRSGLREALELLQVSYAQRLLTKCCGLSLSDQYWICPKDSGLTWDAVNFFDNPFSEDVGNALFGKEPHGKPNLMSPDNTSDGWLRKKWVVMEGKRCLVKCGSNPFQQEPLNEAMASLICKRLGIPHIPYSIEWDDDLPYSVCEDFITPQTDLVSAWHIMQTQKQANHISKYQHFINCCESLEIPGTEEHLNMMLTLDYLIVNEDRHFNNFGAVRDAETLEWIGHAPIYDSGTSLWHDHQVFGHRGKQTPSKPFRESHTEQIELVTDFDWLDIDALDGIENEFAEILAASPHINGERREFLCDALKRRVELLDEVVQGQEQQDGMTLQ
jgi:hypothetical protein